MLNRAIHKIGNFSYSLFPRVIQSKYLPSVNLKKLSKNLSDNYLVLSFLKGNSGKEYGIGLAEKKEILSKIRNNPVKSLTTWQQLLLLVEDILSIPKSMKGDVVECGCYNGASTVILSLACALTKRNLFVCDSFEGLPNPEPDEAYEIWGHCNDYYKWEHGEFSTEGGLEQIKKTIERYGDISVCRFVKGYYKDTLKTLETEDIVLIFEDADIASSVKDCLLYLWPKLQDGCKFYCHEAWSINVVSLFYDKGWWKKHLGTSPPGFYGSGHGIIAGATYANMGYAKKFNAEEIRQKGKKIVQDGSKGS